VLYNPLSMWRIGIITVLLLLVTGGGVWAQIERNPHSRAGAGDEEELPPELELPVAPAEGEPAAISTMTRVMLAQRLVAVISENADFVLGLPSVQPSATDSAVPLDALGAAPPVAPEEAVMEQAPVIESASEPEPAMIEPGPEPEPAAEAAENDQPVVLTEEVLNADEPAPVVEEEEPAAAPVAEPPGAPMDATATLDDLAVALSERRNGGSPEAEETEEAEAEQEEPAKHETPELLHNYSYGLTSPKRDAADEDDDGAPEPDSRRPQLMNTRHDAADDETAAGDESASEDQAEEQASPAANTGEAEASPIAQANAVRTAPAGRAHPEESTRSWRRPRFELPAEQTDPLPEETDEPPVTEEVPSSADIEPPEFSLETPTTVQLGDAALMASGLMLTPAGDAAHPPVDPVLNTAKTGMPNYDVSSRITSVSRGSSRKKQVALTFDDGPHPEFTSQLLAVLEYYDVPATFFYVGVQAQKYPHWVKMTHQAGHEIASQTYDHFRLPKLPREEKIYQIDEYQRLIEGLTGATPRFMRPPGGQVDPETEDLLAERGMVLGMWDVALNDTRDGKTKEQMLSMAKRNIRSGSVVLAHDGIQATVDMLPELIEYLRAQGYEFVTMSELAAEM